MRTVRSSKGKSADDVLGGGMSWFTIVIPDGIFDVGEIILMIRHRL
jgi:hypothetical protein